MIEGPYYSLHIAMNLAITSLDSIDFVYLAVITASLGAFRTSAGRIQY